MFFLDENDSILMQLKRPFKCSSWLYPFVCIENIQIYDNRMKIIGSVEQQKRLWCRPNFKILDEQNEPVFTIVGQCCFAIFGNTNFLVKNSNGDSIGLITRTYRPSSCKPNIFADTDIYQISFHKKLNSDCKSLIISSTFLLEVLYF